MFIMKNITNRFSNLFQKKIAFQMPHGVIDIFEIIDIQKKKGQLVPAISCNLH